MGSYYYSLVEPVDTWFHSIGNCVEPLSIQWGGFTRSILYNFFAASRPVFFHICAGIFNCVKARKYPRASRYPRMRIFPVVVWSVDNRYLFGVALWVPGRKYCRFSDPSFQDSIVLLVFLATWRHTVSERRHKVKVGIRELELLKPSTPKKLRSPFIGQLCT